MRFLSNSELYYSETALAFARTLLSYIEIDFNTGILLQKPSKPTTEHIDNTYFYSLPEKL